MYIIKSGAHQSLQESHTSFWCLFLGNTLTSLALDLILAFYTQSTAKYFGVHVVIQHFMHANNELYKETSTLHMHKERLLKCVNRSSG